VRYAIISDVHSNIHALDTVLEDLDRQGADMIVCAGDLVGYNPFPNEVIAKLRQRRAICIAGNHDRAVVQMNVFNMNHMAAVAVFWTAKRLNEENMEYLRRLRPQTRLNLAGVPAAMFHGSPRMDDEYVFEQDADAELLELAKAGVVISGHTHVPYVKRLPEGTLVNPGSVGQPRDGDWRASYILYDERRQEFEVRRLEYPVVEAVEAVRMADLPEFLGERLLSGI
jgi:predicted phosphodiesterase